MSSPWGELLGAAGSALTGGLLGTAGSMLQPMLAKALGTAKETSPAEQFSALAKPTEGLFDNALQKTIYSGTMTGPGAAQNAYKRTLQQTGARQANIINAGQADAERARTAGTAAGTQALQAGARNTANLKQTLQDMAASGNPAMLSANLNKIGQSANQGNQTAYAGALNAAGQSASNASNILNNAYGAAQRGQAADFTTYTQPHLLKGMNAGAAASLAGSTISGALGGVQAQQNENFVPSNPLGTLGDLLATGGSNELGKGLMDLWWNNNSQKKTKTTPRSGITPPPMPGLPAAPGGG